MAGDGDGDGELGGILCFDLGRALAGGDAGAFGDDAAGDDYRGLFLLRVCLPGGEVPGRWESRLRDFELGIIFLGPGINHRGVAIRLGLRSLKRRLVFDRLSNSGGPVFFGRGFWRRGLLFFRMDSYSESFAMLVLLSPAKSLDYDSPLLTKKKSQPRFVEESAELIAGLRKLSVGEVGELMSISEKLAELNHERFASWEADFHPGNSRQAILAFTGDVYQGMELSEWSAADFSAAQKRVRILSGLYGLLRPLDLMQPYRLEMGTKFANGRGKNLYDFWGSRITELLNADQKKSGSEVVVNLASKEYFSAVKLKELKGELVTPVFKDEKKGTYKIISFYAKKARGMMADYIVRNGVTEAAELRNFKTGGYCLSKGDSSERELVFTRKERG